MSVQCKRVGEAFPSKPPNISGLKHCIDVAETKLSIQTFDVPEKPTIIPLMLFISLFYDRVCSK